MGPMGSILHVVEGSEGRDVPVSKHWGWHAWLCCSAFALLVYPHILLVANVTVLEQFFHTSVLVAA